MGLPVDLERRGTVTIKERNKEIQEKIDGLNLAIECEQAVVDHLESARLRFHAGDKSPDTLRRVRQVVDSRKAVSQFKEELDLWVAVRLGLTSEEIPKEVQKPTRGERSVPRELRRVDGTD